MPLGQVFIELGISLVKPASMQAPARPAAEKGRYLTGTALVTGSQGMSPFRMMLHGGSSSSLDGIYAYLDGVLVPAAALGW